MSPAIVLDARARSAFDAPTVLPAGAVFVNEGGQACIVRADGTLEQLLAGGRPRGGAASDPANVRRPA